MNLASAKHEGMELSFSFLLGNPHSLIHDLVAEHEFLMRGDHKEESLLLGPDRLQVAYSLSLIKGNYAFLQDPELALFISYPGFPLEISHIVRLPTLKARQSSRRSVLAAATRGRRDLLATISYGNGRADALFDGALVGSYSEREGWRQASSYERFWKDLKKELIEIGVKRNSSILNVLELVIEQISDEPGHGAMLAVGKPSALRRVTKQGVPLTQVFDSIEGRTVEEAGEGLLSNLAVEDGATLIDATTGKVSGRWQVHAINPETYSKNGTTRKKLYTAWKDEKSEYYWKNWHKTLHWGTRHMAALGATLALENDGLVIVISADGPVHVLKNGKAATVKIGGNDEDLVYGD